MNPDPQVDVKLESRLEEADRDRDYLRRQLAKHSEALESIKRVCGDRVTPERKVLVIKALVERAQWTWIELDDGER